jgi:hypothetical protein
LEKSHVHHKDMHVQAGLVLLGDHGFLGGVHAADRGAIIMALVSRTDALQEGHTLRRSMIGWSMDMTQSRSGGGQQALELEGSDYVGIASKAEFLG